MNNFPQKMLNETKSSSIGNDLALIAYHYQKLKIRKNKECFIFIENNLKDKID